MLKGGQKTDQSNFRGRRTNNFDSEEEDEKETINEDASSEIEMTFQPQE